MSDSTEPTAAEREAEAIRRKFVRTEVAAFLEENRAEIIRRVEEKVREMRKEQDAER
jgi:hypothetical protein